MVGHKKQHWVPSCYLKPWSDPNTPADHTPYVHVFDRYGGDHRRRGPAKIFKMLDLYTIFEGAERNLRIEKLFSQWGSDFVRVRGLIEAMQFGTDEDAADLYAFVGAVIVRPPRRIDFVKEQWSSIAEMMRTTRIDRNAPPPPSILTGGPSMNTAQVQALADNPMGTWFPEAVGANVDALWRLFGCDILVNDTEAPFLTSDALAVIYHPPISDPRYRFIPRGLGTPGCEITLPVSPFFALLFRQKAPGMYAFLNVDDRRVFEVNFRTITRAHANIVSNCEDISFVLAITQYIADGDASLSTEVESLT